MTIAISLIIAIFILSLGCVTGFWLIIRHRLAKRAIEPTQKAIPTEDITFRWRYVMIPLTTFIAALILITYFYRLLPSEIAYIFKLDGSPAQWLSREMFTGWMLALQFFFIIIAVITTLLTTKMSTLLQLPKGSLSQQAKLLLIVGNMVAMPQVILLFAILDIFSYNSYQVHLLPLWIFAVFIMGLGAIILGIFFIKAIQQTKLASNFDTSNSDKEHL